MTQKNEKPIIDQLLSDEDFIDFVREMFEDVYPDKKITDKEIEDMLLLDTKNSFQ